MTLLLINFSFSVGLIVTVQYYKLHLSYGICITLMYTADYRLRRQITLLRMLGQLECGPMPNLMVALPNIGGALCSTPQSLADAHY